jgi:hypothetical protein
VFHGVYTDRQDEAGWRKEKQISYKLLKPTGSRGHVTIDAHNRPNLGRLSMCWPLYLQRSTPEVGFEHTIPVFELSRNAP